MNYHPEKNCRGAFIRRCHALKKAVAPAVIWSKFQAFSGRLRMKGVLETWRTLVSWRFIGWLSTSLVWRRSAVLRSQNKVCRNNFAGRAEAKTTSSPNGIRSSYDALWDVEIQPD